MPLSTSSISPGTLLRFPVYDQNGVLLLKGGAPLTERLYDLIEARKISLALYATLQVTKGAGEQTEVALKNPTLIIGRAPECDLRPAHGVVSKKHCILRKSAYNVVVRDLKSTNGTFVNGIRVKDETELSDRDVITLGGGVAMTVRIFAAVQGDYGETPQGLIVGGDTMSALDKATTMLTGNPGSNAARTSASPDSIEPDTLKSTDPVDEPTQPS
jgi:predicted component of type VI protein secretion system